MMRSAVGAALAMVATHAVAAPPAAGQAANASAPAAAGPEAEALGRTLAETGTLGSLLPMIEAKETADMVADHPELSAAEQAELKRVAADTAAAGKARLMATMGREYARRLTVADMTTLVAHARSPAAARYRAAQPAVIGAAMQALDGVDFKQDTLKAFCARTGRACAK